MALRPNGWFKIAVNLQSQNIHHEHLNILVIPTGSQGI